MECSDTGKIEAVRLEHLHVPEMSKINQFLAAIKRVLPGGNARISFTVSGGRIDVGSIEPCQVMKLLPDEFSPKTVA